MCAARVGARSFGLRPQDKLKRTRRTIASAAATQKKTKTPARQSGSLQPPKSSAVAPIPARLAVTKAATASPLGISPAGTNLAMNQAAPPANIQTFTPTGARLARDSQEPGSS